MKNFFGEEVPRHVLTFVWNAPILEIRVDGSWCGCVHPNGYLGGSINVHCSLGEPVFTNFNLWHEIGFNDMQMIMTEWARHMTPDRSAQFVISRMAGERDWEFKAALRYVKNQGIPLYAEPKDPAL